MLKKAFDKVYGPFTSVSCEDNASKYLCPQGKLVSGKIWLSIVKQMKILKRLWIQNNLLALNLKHNVVWDVKKHKSKDFSYLLNHKKLQLNVSFEVSLNMCCCSGRFFSEVLKSSSLNSSNRLVGGICLIKLSTFQTD